MAVTPLLTHWNYYSLMGQQAKMSEMVPYVQGNVFRNLYGQRNWDENIGVAMASIHLTYDVLPSNFVPKSRDWML